MVVIKGGSLALICVATITYFISAVAVGVRSWVRLRLTKAFGWDDALLILALVFDTIFAICATGAAAHGSPKSPDELSDDDIKYSLLYWYVGQAGFVLTTVFVKLSISILLLRITVRRYHSWIIYSVIAVTTIVGLIVFFTVVFQCRPVSFFWDRTSQDGKCFSRHGIIALIYVHNITSAICDITIGLLPITVVWNMSFDRKTKTAVVCLMGMGCIACAAVLARIPYSNGFETLDFLHDTVPFVICCHVEVTLGIVAASLATLRPLLRYIRQHSSARGRSDPTTIPSTSPPPRGENGGDRGDRHPRELNPLSVLSPSSQRRGSVNRDPDTGVDDTADKVEEGPDHIHLETQRMTFYTEADGDTSEENANQTVARSSSDESHTTEGKRSTREYNAV